MGFLTKRWGRTREVNYDFFQDSNRKMAKIKFSRLRKPIQFVLERFDDMAISGTRHPFYFEYKLALDENNKFIDTEVNCYSNAGATLDLSPGVMGEFPDTSRKIVTLF